MLTPNGLPSHKLVLKETWSIVFLRNLDPSNEVCNGTRLVRNCFESNVIHA